MSGREFAKQDDAVDAVKKSLKVSFIICSQHFAGISV
jgi:hypothetical protein